MLQHCLDSKVSCHICSAHGRHMRWVPAGEAYMTTCFLCLCGFSHDTLHCYVKVQAFADFSSQRFGIQCNAKREVPLELSQSHRCHKVNSVQCHSSDEQIIVCNAVRIVFSLCCSFCTSASAKHDARQIHPPDQSACGRHLQGLDGASSFKRSWALVLYSLNSQWDCSTKVIGSILEA